MDDRKGKESLDADGGLLLRLHFGQVEKAKLGCDAQRTVQKGNDSSIGFVGKEDCRNKGVMSLINVKGLTAQEKREWQGSSGKAQEERISKRNESDLSY